MFNVDLRARYFQAGASLVIVFFAGVGSAQIMGFGFLVASVPI
jgi:hypothetical protein